MKQILVFIFDGYADWEPAYVCAQLNAPGTGYAVKTIGLDRAPKVSMGGFRVTPDFTVADYPRDAGLLLLTGGTAWLERKNDAVLPVVRELVRCHIPVAAICNAVNFLAENGFLDILGIPCPSSNPRLRTIKGRHISLRRRRFVTTAFLPPTDSERWSWQKRYCGC